MPYAQTQPERLLRNLDQESSYFDFKRESSLSHPFVKTAVSDLDYWGQPSHCPLNNHLQMFRAPQAQLITTTTYGGPGSKYKNINEDSYFFGINKEFHFIAGVIDGSGGSKYGYLGGKLANEALAYQLHKGIGIDRSFETADEYVVTQGKGGYATGVAVEIDENLKVQMGSKGDSRALTIRDGHLLKEGTTRIQSIVARKIEQGKLPAHAIHTASKKNVIYSIIGNRCLPLCQREFQGQADDMIILGSDGLWDVVSDYEALEMAKLLNGHQLQTALYLLAFQRNNSRSEFQLEFNAGQSHLIRPLFANGGKCRGDNITVQVIQLTNS